MQRLLSVPKRDRNSSMSYLEALTNIVIQTNYY